MKLFHTVAATLAVFLLISTTGVSSQGFLSTLRNAFSGRPVRQSQPARPAFRPQPQQQQQQFQQQPQQQQFQQQPQQQQFQAQPQQQTFQQQPQQFQQQQQPQQFAQQPQQFQTQGQRFNPQPQQVRQQRPQQNIRPFVSRPAQSQQASVAFRNQNSNSNSNSNSNNNNAAPVNSCPALPREDLNDREGPSRCPDGLAPAFQYRGMNVILTWKEDSHPSWNEGCRNFTGIQADNYCRAQGGRAASLDTNEAAEQYMKQSAIYAQRYYWTGGRLNHRCGVLSWPSGKTEGWIKGQRFWSPTGGSASKGPQPDNRHELEDGHPGEPEKCLGVLNNFYADGIKWHDVACHHRKPTICEVPINRG